MRRLGATLAVALLLVTAGCSGFLGDDSKQGFTATPVDVPTDEPTPTPTEIVPGVGVSRTGAILGYSLEYSIQRAGENYYVWQYYSVGQVGNTTVERPSWVETAPGEGGDATPESAS
ncbi:hypothetical protein [Haladaptatus sp. ZSTT2]|uniref:hypothetical protein n=1 Tax=Haladaptatus sp. ZSTT2 TaxID=3120515 RepID=UPI00300E790A